MRIAQVSHIYLPHLGGIEFYVKRLVDDLKKNKIISKVLTTDMDTSIEGRKKEAEYFKTSFSFMRNPFSWQLIDHLKKNEYDIMHLHNIWFLPSLEAVLFRKNARIITTMHGVYPDNASFGLRFFLNLYKPLAKYILNKSEKIITLSNSEKEKLIEIFKIDSKKIVVIPNGIFLEEYKKQKKENIILFTGRIIQDKNPELLIKASGILNENFNDFKVVFIGPVEEDYKKCLISLSEKLGINENVQFVNPLDQSKPEEKKKFMDFYKKSKVFVSIGSWEGLPTRIMEAMQFETPCIAYSSGGSSELVKDNYNGLVIDKLDEKMLVEKIERLLKDQELVKRLGENARETIKKSFDWNKIFKKILEVYKR